MKKIEAVVRLSKFDAIRDALADIGVRFFTMSDVKGFGLQKEQRVYRGSVYDADYIARLQLDIVANDSKVDEIVETIVKAGRTGNINLEEGKAFETLRIPIFGNKNKKIWKFKKWR